MLNFVFFLKNVKVFFFWVTALCLKSDIAYNGLTLGSHMSQY